MIHFPVPDQSARFGALRDRQLAAVTDAGGRDAGIALGEAAAQAILADREADGWDTEAAYQWQPMAPGARSRAIRWAANDGNPDTVPDKTWDNLHRHTYPFPSYPSAHGTACAAAMSALAAGTALGRRIGRHVIGNYLRPRR